MAAIMTLVIPDRMVEPDDWAYYYGVQNFSQGKLVIDSQLHTQQMDEAKKLGGQLGQYVQLADNKWALEKAPGYVFFLVPFELLHIPKWGNVLLALGLVIVMYLLLKRLRDEKTACVGSLLILFTPVSLIMLHRSYVDSFAAGAFLAMGGGLYIYYSLEVMRRSPIYSGVLLFLAFLFISWSVVVRYTNLPVAAVFVVHFIVTRCLFFFKGEKRKVLFETPSIIIGIIISLVILLWYDITVFGSPFDYGYNYTHASIKFAFQFIGQVNGAGESIPLNIIEGNMRNMPMALLLGFPLLVVGLPGFGVVLYQKLATPVSDNPPGKKYNLDSELSWDTLGMLIGWFVFVFVLYMLYEWTSPAAMADRPFIFVDRFYLPGLFPIAVITSLVMTRLPTKLLAIIVLIIVLIGSFLYVQSAVWGKSVTGTSQNVPLQQLSPQTTLQSGQEDLISRIRQEVKTTPTNTQNLHLRYQVLQMWIGQLINRGYPTNEINKILSPERMQSIGQLINSGKIAEASKQIDQGYSGLEAIAGKLP